MVLTNAVYFNAAWKSKFDEQFTKPQPFHLLDGADADVQTMIQTGDCAEALFFIASQAHTMGVIQLPLYQPFGGMPPQVPTPWLPGLEIKPA